MGDMLCWPDLHALHRPHLDRDLFLRVFLVRRGNVDFGPSRSAGFQDPE